MPIAPLCKRNRGISYQTFNIQNYNGKLVFCLLYTSIIYTGGGKLLAVLPKGCGEELCEEMKQGVEKVTITAQSNFASMETSLEELTQHFATVGKKMDGILEERQNLRWNFLFQSPVSRENITGIEDEQDYTELEDVYKRQALYNPLQFISKKIFNIFCAF